LCRTGSAFGVKTEAVISDMNQPLGKYVGNALEIYECVKILRGETDAAMLPTLELSVELAARMLVLCGVAETIEDSKFKIQNSLDSGAALEKFRLNIECQNGDSRICDDPESLLDKNLTEIEIKAKKSGFINEIDTHVVGESISTIGGGRIRVEDRIDFAVGYECAKTLGGEVKSGETIGVVFCRSEAQADSIYEKLANAYKIGDEKLSGKYELIKEVVS
jgi:pyrimidine-nucleoside phosphorylase